MAKQVSSPNWEGWLPSGPVMAVTMPLWSDKNDGSRRHCGQVGRASWLSPASSSSRNDDQMTMAALPARYAARVLMWSWLPWTDPAWIRSTWNWKVSTQGLLVKVMAPAWLVSWQPLATARYSKVCWVKESGLVAATIPAIPSLVRVVAAARIAAKVVGAARPALANRSLRYTSSWVQLSLGTATGWPFASTRLSARREKVWRPRVSMTAAAASGSVMPSAAKECANPSDTAASTSGSNPAAPALVS